MAVAGDLDSLSPLDSLTAYQVLEEIGVSKNIADMHETMINDGSFATNVMLSSCFPGSRGIFTGSGRDGMTGIYLMTGTQTDIDFMDIKDTLIAVERSDDTKDDSTLLQFLVENEDIDNPAFAKLLLLKEGTNFVNVAFRMTDSVYQERNGRLYLSSDELKKLTKNVVLELAISNIFQTTSYLDSIMLQGPASTTNFSSMNLGFQNGFSWENIDVVFAIPFPFWPGVASEWIQRPQRTHWPNRATIDRIKGQGCYMVPKCSKDGRDQVLEWAFSFAHVEPILVKSMNDVMLKTYAFLKLTRIGIFQAVAECQIISSYILKTSLFWEVESTEEDEWVPEKLLHCVRRCLRRLQFWIEDEFVPHYFIRNQTLISRRLNHLVKERVLECLTSTVNTLDIWFRNIPPFLSFLRSRSTEEVLEDYFRNTSLNMNVPDKQIILSDVCRRMSTYLSSTSVSSVIGSCASRHCMSNPDWIISFRHEIDRLLPNDTSSTCNRVSFSILLIKVLSLEIDLANELLRRQNNTCNKYIYRKTYKSNCIRKLNKCGLVPFAVLGNLVQELLQHMMPLNIRKFEMCIQEIERCIEGMEHFKLNHTDIQNIGTMLISNVFRNVDQILERQSLSHGRSREIFINEIHLTELELSVLPPILILEIHCRLDTDLDGQTTLKFPQEFILSLDSEALFYFLSFCLYHALDRNIEKYKYLRKLESLCHRIDTLHRHLAWSLYGHCLSHMGQYREAFRAYFTSMLIQERNVDLRTMSKATAWHVAILLNKYSLPKRRR